MLTVLSLGTFWFPSRAHADSSTVGPLAPSSSGPLIGTYPLFKSDTPITTSLGNYMQLTEYTWAFDPLLDADPNHDYYIIFVSGAVQAKATGYCLSDGRQAPFGLSPVWPPSETVNIHTESGTIMTDEIRPVNGDHGDELGVLGLSLGVQLGPEDAKIEAGISWSQTIYAWTVRVTSLNSTDVTWETTIAKGLFPPIVCNKDGWVWGYTSGISVSEGRTPRIDVTLTGNFFTKPCLTCPGQLDPEGTVGPNFRSLSISPAISFETNPLTGANIAFSACRGAFSSCRSNGTEFVHGQHAFFVPGTYLVMATPPDDYSFAGDWDMSGGVSRANLDFSNQTSLQLCCNPTIVNVTGNGVLRAVFLPKLTFLTDPPDKGAIGISAGWPYCPADTSFGSEGWFHNGDWTFLPSPRVTSGHSNSNTELRLCFKVPDGYRFDHFTTTAEVVSSFSNDPSPTIAVAGPTTIEAWFSPTTSSPSPDAPSAPSSLVATGQYGHVDLSWNPPLSDGGSHVTGYQIYKGNSFGSVSLLTLVGNQLWYQDSSVSNGQVYYYRVTAANSAGESPTSNADSARPGVDRITVSPDPRSVLTSGQVQFSAVARAESGEIVQGASFSWTTSVPGASITNAGLFKAGTIVGTFTEEVSALAEGVTGYATVIVQAPPSTRAGTASLPIDFSGLWTWALIPGILALVVGLFGVMAYRRRAGRRPKTVV